VAIKICVEISSRAFTCVNIKHVASAADRADNDVSGEVTLFDRVTEFVAAEALANERKRVKNLSDTRGAEHEHGVFSDTRKTGTIFI